MMKNRKVWGSSSIRRLPLVLVAVLLAGLALAVTLVPLARADTTLYVRPAGDDMYCNGAANLDYTPTTAPNCALKTLQKAFSLAGSSGTVIYTDGSSSTTFPVGDGIGAANGGLKISKSDSSDPVDVGDPLIYTIIVTYTGVPTDVTVTDLLPPPGIMTYDNGSATASQGTGCVLTIFGTSRKIDCLLGTLNTNATATVTIPVTPTAAGVIENFVVASTNTGNDSATETTTISGTTRFSISKIASPDPAPLGTPLTYLVTVTNSGPVAAISATISDLLPTSTTFIPASSSSECSETGGVVTCDLDFLNVGASTTLTITVIPTLEGVITNTAVVTPSGFDDDLGNNQDTITTTVITALTHNVYLPIILKNFAGPFATLSWLHKNEDRVSDADGAAGLITDTIKDGAFLATVNVGSAGSKTVSHAHFESTQGIIWDTLNGSGIQVLGVFDGITRLNDPADGTIDGMTVNGQVTVSIYAADDVGGTRFPPEIYTYTLTVFFDDGTSVSAQAIIPASTPLPPPPTNLAYVSDVAADIDTNRIFIASPRHNWVYVIDGTADDVTDQVAVGVGPTGLTVLETTAPITNKVFVAHQYGANFYRPGVKAFEVDESTSHDTDDEGYVGVVPIKIAANGPNSRVYVSNYIDNLAVLDGASAPPETRLGWVVQKAYQGAYGIDTSSTTNRAYLATRDTGELVVFDGNLDRLLGSGYVPTHVKPPQTCNLWSVAVNESTGHVFVPCPALSKVFVLVENQISVLSLESLGVLENRNGHLALVVAPQAAPWIAEIDVPGGTNLGQEGIAVDTDTGHVFITNASNDSLVILQDGSSPAYVTTVAVGDQPQGVDVNRITQKVYVGNAGDNTVTVLNAVSPFSVTKTIPLFP